MSMNNVDNDILVLAMGKFCQIKMFFKQVHVLHTAQILKVDEVKTQLQSVYGISVVYDV
jgi:hypothetical protein